MLGWRKHRRLVLIAMLWVGGATAAIAATHPLWPHHALALSPGYALAGAAGIAAVAKWLRAHVAPSNIRAALLGCVAAAAFAGLLAPGFAYLRVVADSRPIVNALRQLTPAGSDVLGDEQFDQALAGRLAPAQFIDTSVTRLVGSGVTAKRLEDALQGDSHVCAVLFATNRLSTRAGFETWVAEHATQRIEVRDATVYLLRRCAT